MADQHPAGCVVKISIDSPGVSGEPIALGEYDRVSFYLGGRRSFDGRIDISFDKHTGGLLVRGMQALSVEPEASNTISIVHRK